MYIKLLSCVYTYIHTCNTDGRSVINTASVNSNPNDVMDTYSVVVTCEINPTSTAEYCEVFAESSDTTLTGT